MHQQHVLRLATWARIVLLSLLLGVAILTGSSLSGRTAHAQPASTTTAPPTPVLNWHPCVNPPVAGFECATAKVPLDYTDAHGAMINLAVIKHTATNPAHRIGSLFFNPGGPGGAGTEDLPAFYTFFPTELQQDFDLISWVSLYARFSTICNQANPTLLSHVSTAESVRDMDLLRQAVGDSQSWFDEPCATWQATDADGYFGPWNRWTANAVLVVGNTYDPSTPYQDSVKMANKLARARLLTVDGYGHTDLLNPSHCVNGYESSYFVHGALPSTGTICHQDRTTLLDGPPVVSRQSLPVFSVQLLKCR